MDATTPAQGRKAGAKEWLGLTVLALPTLVMSVDVTVLYLALPHLGADLQPSANQTLWIIDIFGFLLAGFLITMGTLGDRIGRRRLLMIGGAGFAVASLVAAYANSAEMLIAARALLGFFGATLMPSTLSLISNMFADSKQRAQAVAIWAACVSSGIAIGPPVGGLLLESFWWGSVFLLAVPVMVLLLVAAPFLLPEYKSPSAHKLDLVSVGLSLASVIPVIWSIKELAEDGLQALPLAVLVAGLLLGVLFVMRQKRLTEPLLDVSLFRNSEFSATLLMLLVGVGVVGGVYLFISQYLQLIKDQGPMEAGLWMLPSAFVMMVTAAASPALVRWVRPGFLVGGGLAISATGYFMLLGVGADDGLSALVIAMIVLFSGLGPVFALGTDLVLGTAPPERSGSAAAMSETAMEFGISLGIALLGSVGAAVYRNNMEDAVPDGLSPEAAEAAVETLPGAMAVAAEAPPEVGGPLAERAFAFFMDGFHASAVVCGITVGLFALVSFGLLRNARTKAQIDAEAAKADDEGRDELAAAAAR
ncbi:MFS transporter [Streptomyces sp. GSL17-111]|uniref:MFS transporter n=1 Tax=Streptomyces sp. GSL17-111 TaxID=3121596 RepID=UPI0030F389CF